MIAPVALLVMADLLRLHAAYSDTRGRPTECYALPGGAWRQRLGASQDPAASALLRSARERSRSKLVAGGPDGEGGRHAVADEAGPISSCPGERPRSCFEGRALAPTAREAPARRSRRSGEAKTAIDDEHAARRPDGPPRLGPRAVAGLGDDAVARPTRSRALLPRASVLPLADRAVSYLASGLLIMATRLARRRARTRPRSPILRQARRDLGETCCKVCVDARARPGDRSVEGDGEEGSARRCWPSEGMEQPRPASLLEVTACARRDGTSRRRRGAGDEGDRAGGGWQGRCSEGGVASVPRGGSRRRMARSREGAPESSSAMSRPSWRTEASVKARSPFALVAWRCRVAARDASAETPPLSSGTARKETRKAVRLSASRRLATCTSSSVMRPPRWATGCGRSSPRACARGAGASVGRGDLSWTCACASISGRDLRGARIATRTAVERARQGASRAVAMATRRDGRVIAGLASARLRPCPPRSHREER